MQCAPAASFGCILLEALCCSIRADTPNNNQGDCMAADSSKQLWILKPCRKASSGYNTWKCLIMFSPPSFESSKIWSDCKFLVRKSGLSIPLALQAWLAAISLLFWMFLMQEIWAQVSPSLPLGAWLGYPRYESEFLITSACGISSVCYCGCLWVQMQSANSMIKSKSELWVTRMC